MAGWSSDGAAKPRRSHTCSLGATARDLDVQRRLKEEPQPIAEAVL